jgi:exopolysaccharide biosynthesis polyprenyl glycosylphosphotransferase
VTRERTLEQSILFWDIVALLVSLFLAREVHAPIAAALPGLKPPVEAEAYAHLLLVFLPTWVFAAERLGIHLTRTLIGPRLEVVRLVVITQAWGLAAMAVILVAAQTALNRSLIAIFMVLSTTLLLLAKMIERRWVIRRRGEALTLLVGDATGQVASEIERIHGRHVERFHGSDPDALAARFRAGHVDEVMLAGALPTDRVHRLVELCAEAGLPAFVAIDAGGDSADDLPPPVVETVGRAQYLVYHRRRLDTAPLLIKAVLDWTLALALLLLLLPALLLVALAVLLFIGRPIFYVQRRGGLFGRAFPMLKFRTMRVGADREQALLRAHNEMDGPVFKMTNDPRVTRFGRILRRTSVDELPQLLNVLCGHMSLVGPRPLPLAETQALHGGHRRRLAMRPGLTCLWQVSGRNDLTFGEWMALDLEYIDRWSLGLDVAILLRTLPAILSARGAR